MLPKIIPETWICTCINEDIQSFKKVSTQINLVFDCRCHFDMLELLLMSFVRDYLFYISILYLLLPFHLTLNVSCVNITRISFPDMVKKPYISKLLTLFIKGFGLVPKYAFVLYY